MRGREKRTLGIKRAETRAKNVADHGKMGAGSYEKGASYGQEICRKKHVREIRYWSLTVEDELEISNNSSAQNRVG